MGRKQEGLRMGGPDFLNQKAKKFARDRSPKGFGPIDKAVKDASRESRMKQYLQDLEERQRLVEMQQAMYSKPVLDKPPVDIQQSGETMRTIEETEVERAPIETIEKPLEFVNRSPIRDQNRYDASAFIAKSI